MDLKTWLSRQSHTATSVFHMGRYCGKWKATTYDTGHPSFHVVLEGECWLALEAKYQRIQLHAGDMIFFFTNRPFHLLSSPAGLPEQLPLKTMRAISNKFEEDTALLCGFLTPANYQSELLFTLMPEYLLIRRKSRSGQRLNKLFELLKFECWQAETECALTITRLTDLLLIYVVEEIIDAHFVDVDLLQASQSERVSLLIMAIIRSPSEKWSIDRMAVFMHMSRSTFIRNVQATCGCSPNTLVLRLKINVAINLLRRGQSVNDVYQQVGYESLAGFYSAFRKVTTETPSEFMRNTSFFNSVLP